MIIKEELKRHIWPLKPEERDHLEKILLEEGCRDALVYAEIDGENVLLDGHNRYEICEGHGLKYNTVLNKNVKTIEQAKDWMDANQVGRRNLTADQFRISIGRRYLSERKTAETQSRGNRFTVEGGKNYHPEETENTDKKLSTEYNVSPKTVRNYARQAEQYKRLQAEQPQLAEAVWRGERTFKDALHKRRIASQENRTEHLEKKDFTPCDKKYRVIYADPPWQYNMNRANYGGDARDHYTTMSIEDLCAMPVKKYATDDSVLFIWVTSPFLERSFEVIKAWGFKYKASFVWDKIKHNMGHYNSVRHEFLLICTRGSATPENRKLFDSVQSIERSGEHSSKPIEFYNIIETLYPSANKIELFSRNIRQGWDGWGNEYKAD